MPTPAAGRLTNVARTVPWRWFIEGLDLQAFSRIRALPAFAGCAGI